MHWFCAQTIQISYDYTENQHLHKRIIRRPQHLDIYILSLRQGVLESNRVESEPVSAWVTSECDKSIEHPAFRGPHLDQLKLLKPPKCGMLELP